ncbi:MAG: amidohydrolase [Clostridia bacterium]|nr:amidohydrolase [Clostridia bacterium]
MIIDSHAHIFPNKIAEKASTNIGNFYSIPMKYDGTLESLLKCGETCSIDKFIVQSVATTEKQVDNINDFVAQTVENHQDKLIGFATLHPNSTCIAKQVDNAIKMGLRGIKLHPDFQNFNIDSKEAFSIYEAIEGRLPLLIHMGDHRTQFSKPAKLAPVLDKFPKLDVIAAHFGGWSEWESGALELALKRVYVDTSSSMYALKPHQVRELIDIFGVDFVLFGSDYPMWSPKDELDMLAKVDLTKDEREKIYHKNIETLLAKYE